MDLYRSAYVRFVFGVQILMAPFEPPTIIKWRYTEREPFIGRNIWPTVDRGKMRPNGNRFSTDQPLP